MQQLGGSKVALVAAVGVSHVAVPVEGLHPCEELVVVAHVDENLRVVLHTLHEDRERARVEFILFLLGGLVTAKHQQERTVSTQGK
jgi:hypothetical protein